jgi:hypothetical protein
VDFACILAGVGLRVWDCRNAPAVGALVHDLLTPKLIGIEGVERCDQVARQTLSKVNALLDGSTIWTFAGCQPPSKSEKLAA